MGKLRIISYNCQSFNSKHVLIDSLMDSCDILCLQKTFIADENADNFDALKDDFVYAYTPAVRKHDVISGRCSGGLAIFWRKDIDLKCSPVMFSERIMGLSIEFQNVSYLIVNVYFFCDYGDIESLLNYKSMLAELSNICEDSIFDDIILVGDMNADPSKGWFLYRVVEFY